MQPPEDEVSTRGFHSHTRLSKTRVTVKSVCSYLFFRKLHSNNLCFLRAPRKAREGADGAQVVNFGKIHGAPVQNDSPRIAAIRNAYAVLCGSPTGFAVKTIDAIAAAR